MMTNMTNKLVIGLPRFTVHKLQVQPHSSHYIHQLLAVISPDQIDLDSLGGSQHGCKFNYKKYMLVTRSGPGFLAAPPAVLGQIRVL